MSEATEGQARGLIASFAVDTPWTMLEKRKLQQFYELPPTERGKRFAAFLNNGGDLNVVSQPAPTVYVSTCDVVFDWPKAAKALGMQKQFAECMDAFEPAGPGEWPIYVPKGLTIAKLATTLKKSGSGWWSWYDDPDAELADDPEKDFKANERDANRDGMYAIAVRATIEADEENANKSKNMLAKEGHKGMTALERVLLELPYFLTTQSHLDLENVTLCPASLYRRGDVPRVHFYGRVRLDGDGPGDHDGILRSRSVRVLAAKSR